MKRLFLAFLYLFITIHTQTPKEYINVSFASLYPKNAFHDVKRLATQLWSELEESIHNQTTYNHLQTTLTDFSDTILELHVLVDILLKKIQPLQALPERYHEHSTSKITQELHYLYELIDSLHKHFDHIMHDTQNDQAACVTVVLDYIKRKMERMLTAPAP